MLIQQYPNPDVNTPDVDIHPQNNPDVEPSHSDEDGEDKKIPVPPDVEPSAPVEDPPVNENEEEKIA